MRCEFLKEHRGEFGPIRKACGILRVSKSEYYDYVMRRKSNAQIEREALEGFVAERFDLHKGRYGYRRINRELGRDGIVVSEKRVLSVMRKLGNGKGHLHSLNKETLVSPSSTSPDEAQCSTAPLTPA